MSSAVDGAHGRADRRSRKTFAVVSAVYNVASYLPDFIASIESQDYPLDDVEIVLVDDGSTDESRRIVDDWAQRRPELVTVLAKPNGGQSSARNLGLGRVDAEWVTFTDPDDKMGSGYLSAVKKLLDRFPPVPMVATNRIYLDDLSGKLQNAHPLRTMFADGDKRVELDRFPQYFWHHVGAGFFKLDEIRRLELTFDERVRPNFEDGHFCLRYLLGTEQAITFAASAHYHYRRRADQSSTLQRSFLMDEKYTHIPKFGYLDCLQRAKTQLGFVPEWLQNMIIYDLSWYFTAEDAVAGARTAARGAVADEFIASLAQIRTYLDDHVIEGFKIRPVRSSLREILLHSLVEADWHSPYVVLDRYDTRHRLVRARYRYVGEPPLEEILLRGLPVTATHGKTRQISYFGADLLHERIMWLSVRGTLRVRLDRIAMPLVRREPPVPDTHLRPSAVERLVRASPAARPSPFRRFRRRRLANAFREDRRLAAAARSLPVRSRFRRAWVLMDRTHDAGDNAERLFEHLRDRRPDINAWFVIERGTPDWTRLRNGPHGRRVIAYGSATWKLLMLNCAHLVSSHAEGPVIKPAALARLPTPKWKFTFLQHGVIKDDLSRWLNTKWMIDLFVTTTEPEYESIAGDGAYIFTSKEVQRTGLPRFDRLTRLARNAGTPDLMLVAPTWRRWLNSRDRPGTQRKDVIPDFGSSEYARAWTALLSSPVLADQARRHGLRICFLPHSNIRPALPSMALPDHVEVIDPAEKDVQDVFARTAVLVTDYSSIAFDIAYLGRPLVYFQFDRGRTLGGDHTYWPSYFDYARHGFGPVTETVDEAARAVGLQLDCDGDHDRRTYAERAARTFTFRDEGNCERVVAAIEGL